MRPPGKTHAPPWNASLDDRRANNTSSPATPSRNNTTVAAGAASTELVNLQITLLVPGAQHLLVELAHGGLRHLVDEAPALRHLPLRDLRRKVPGELVGSGRATGL